MTTDRSRTSTAILQSDDIPHETRGFIVEKPATRRSRRPSIFVSRSKHMPALRMPARRLWTPPTLIQTKFVNSFMKYRWWKSASDTPLRSPQDCTRWTDNILDFPEFEIGDVFIHRFPNPIRDIQQQTWILHNEGWKDVSASFAMGDGTILHPLYQDTVLIRHNAAGDPGFVLRNSFFKFQRKG